MASKLGSFLTGFQQGANIGGTIRDAMDRNQVNQIAQTEAEDAGTGVKVTGGGEVATMDPTTAKMMADQEQYIRAFNGDTAPVQAKPMTNFGGDLIQTDVPMDAAGVERVRTDKMMQTARKLGNYGLAGEIAKSRQDAMRLADVEQQDANQREIAKLLRPPLVAGGVEPTDTYMTRIAPRVVQTYLNQGAPEKAMAFQNFVDSTEGRGYLRAYGKAMKAYAVGDFTGAIPHLENLYNNAYPDGHRTRITPLQDGNFRWERLGPDGNVRSSGTAGARDLADLGIVALSPAKLVEFEQTRRVAAEKAEQARQAAVEKAEQAQELETLRQDRQDDRASANNAAMDRRLSRQLDAREQPGGLTVPQQRANAEIQAARRALTGKSRAEVARRAMSTIDGFSNPDYDPQVSALWRRANTRLYGNDPAFDSFQVKVKPAPPSRSERFDMHKRFTLDPKMKGYRAGKFTPEGLEILNGDGSVAGHYQ